MKNSLTSFTFFAFAFFAMAFMPVSDPPVEEATVKWYTWEEAVEASKKERRKVFVDVYTEWCGWCKKMDKTTFSDPKVVAYLNKYYYPIKLDAEQTEDILFQGKTFKFIPSGRKGYHELAAALLDGKLSFPTVIFLNEDFQIMQRLATYLEPETFDMVMRYLGDDDIRESMSWADYQKKYKEDQM